MGQVFGFGFSLSESDQFPQGTLLKDLVFKVLPEVFVTDETGLVLQPRERIVASNDRLINVVFN